MSSRSWLLVALALLLAACGIEPRPPHWGNPGGAAPWLSRPLAVRIAIPPPEAALLPSADAARLAEAVSTALQAGDVPATATTPLPLDWRLVILAENQGGTVRPTYRLLDADGRPQGSVGGNLVPVAAWAAAEQPTLDAVASDAGAKVAQLILGIQAARASASPAALAAGPERVRLLPATGAPGDGNQALTARLREFLSAQGYVVQDIADGAAFAVTAEVSVVPAPAPRTERVEIQWIVSRRDGHELGRVLQLNEVPAGRLNGFWGDIAFVAAQEAAGGVRQVIRNAANP
ncbi:hypothetical protein [Roseococcus thiosulfatophilus]|uniref:hypothetical protein n=1 Tax=Roseococcus thiosulfatophilus TaxID=35813 RepID=UPI001A8D9311|nr:hypothetical protein [Roseococcus thiosulfatophilus]